ncbi:TetR family transcriptional regulator [Streptomyces sp. NBC_01433]|uniref:TetR/AcrR family transcriptional regulator n=1 Tax=Streptomyces sp. NBC_01433 TaxID=2903864 RepID=UPI002252B078|nr:TetR/AcrR family transcriptional regulator [Streptomyces sp. NBC_01433]MCX4681782.1 TetR family transcriptional regulator [Streptomyces sp. NBC_01433]
MVKQERAARTREGLVRAAAAQFDQDGYAGASLAKISRAAGISLGAVTFHFPSKAELAEAVEEEGRAEVTGALRRMADASNTPLQQLADLTLELARLIEREDTVRALLRLERERAATDHWTEIWLPTADELLRRAYDSGDLRASAHPEAMTTLVVHLVAGSEIVLRRHRTAGAPAHESAVDMLARIWQLVLTGISASEAARL